MATDVTMPRLSDSMEEGTVVKWLVEVGATVERGQTIVEIDTDKATMAYEAEEAGTLVAILVPEGGTAPIGAPIARIGAPGETGGETEGETEAELEEPEPEALPQEAGARANASPIARRLAGELGVDLATIAGTGPRGSITKEDVQRAGATTPTAAATEASVEPLSRVQQVVARRVAEAKEAPVFWAEVEVDATRALALRDGLRGEADPVPSVNDLVVKAAALALREHPRLNGSFTAQGFELHERIHVGVAVSAPDALLVPVLRDADRRPLGELAAEARSLAERVREGTIGPADLGGATFTVTNLGMFGVRRFAPIIDPPQAAILAVGSVERIPRYDDAGELQPADVLCLTLVSDHRIVYGADAARFLARVRELLEREPEQLFAEPS